MSAAHATHRLHARWTALGCALALLVGACAAPTQRDDSQTAADTAGQGKDVAAVADTTRGAPPHGAISAPQRCALAAPPAAPAWLRDGVGYQVWVRSFADSDGDGVGDLRGLIDHIDVLNDGKPGGDDLGVTVLWLSPIFASPSDHGYDTTDYGAIQPAYGTKKDLEDLLKAAHARGMRVMLDLVLNHCSSEHPWFKASAADPKGAKRDWFSWRADNPGWTQPWGKGQTWHKHASGAWFYGLFWQGMPDLNVAHEPVAAALEQIAVNWVALGVDGYRLDAARYLVESGGGAGQADTPGTHAFWKRLRKALTKVKPDVALVGEVWTDAATVATYLNGDELHGAFDFDGCAGLRKGLELRSPAMWRSALCKSNQPSGTFGRFAGNHDMPRLADIAEGLGQRKLALAAVLLAPGTPWIYQGDELGLPSGPEGGDRRYRLPLPWTAEAPGYGFTKGKPWMPIPSSYGALAWAKQQADGLSLWRWAQRIIALRAATPALRQGAVRVLELDDSFGLDVDGDVVVWTAGTPGEPGAALVALNFGTPKPLTLPKALTAGAKRVLGFGAGDAPLPAPGVGVWRW